MSKIWFTSDLHLGHDKEFLYAPRGYTSIAEHDSAIIQNWNNVVSDEDDVYILGDLMLGDLESGMDKLKQLKGNIHIVYGNHDTNRRIAAYKEARYDCVGYSTVIKCGKYRFYLCHYPTVTSNLERGESLSVHLICLYGHTHQTNNFYNEIPFMYHVGLDSHNCKLVSVEEVISDIRVQTKNCCSFL